MTDADPPPPEPGLNATPSPGAALPDDGVLGTSAPAEWAAWLRSPPGRYVLAWQQAQFDRTVADVFGFHAVQLGLPEIDALRENRMPLRVAGTIGGDVAADAGRPGVARVAIERPEELPFETASLDLVVLPHVLEFAEHPHEVLREVDRVLRPEGRIIVSGFNPFSLWGARQALPRPLAAPFLPREGHFIGVPRLRDWFKLLSFHVDRGRFGCYAPACRTGPWLERFAFMEHAGDRWWPICGAVYFMAGVKRVGGMRLVGPAWKRRAARGGPVVAVAPPAANPHPNKR